MTAVYSLVHASFFETVSGTQQWRVAVTVVAVYVRTAPDE